MSAIINLNARLIKFLTAVDNFKTTASRSKVAIKLWGRHRYFEKLNEILNAPEMVGALLISRFQRRGKGGQRGVGRPQIRYRLTRAGRVLLKRLIREQALAIQAAAKAAQQAKAAARQRKTEEVEVRREALAIVRGSRRKRPKPRFWGDPETAVIAPPMPSEFRPPVAPLHSVASSAPLPPMVPRRPYELIQRAPLPGFMPTAQAPGVYIGTSSASASATLAKIKTAGFRTNDRGEVLFDGRWISASEWMARNGGVLDSSS